MLAIGITIVTIILLALIGYLLGRVSQWISELEKDRHLPYRLRNGLEDISAVDTDTLFRIRDALLLIEARMGDKQRIVAQIRNGRYDPEQPAAPRRQSTGDSPKPRARQARDQ